MKMTRTIIYSFCILCFLSSCGPEPSVRKQWTPEQAWEWYKMQPWLCGLNYIPATCINSMEMWQEETFDLAYMDKELTLAEDIGFNCLRVFVNYLAWEMDSDGIKERMDQFMEICKNHEMRVMWCLFDDCAFGDMVDPVAGIQPGMVDGWYAYGWTPSPGHSMVYDTTSYARLETYVKDVIGYFRNDERVLLWDVYNEPKRADKFPEDDPLLARVMKWTWAANPVQPITTSFWGWSLDNSENTRNKLIAGYNDISGFHTYSDSAETAKHVRELKQYYNRPVIVTEWLNRPIGSRPETHLPIFLEERIGCIHWGLVNGKTQTHYPWGHKTGDAEPEPGMWQHDLFHKDFTAYSIEENRLFHYYIKEGLKK